MNRPVVIYQPSPGGGEQRGNVVLANALAECGMGVWYVMPKLAGPFLSELRANVNTLSLSTHNPVVAAMRLARILPVHRPSHAAVIASHTFGVITAVMARAYAGSDAKIIGVQHNILSEICRQSRSRKMRVLMPRIVRWLYPQADRLVAVSQAAATDLAKMTGIRASEIAVIPSTTITPQIAELAKEPTGEAWLDYKDAPVILAVGDLRAVKDYETLIRAFVIVRQKTACRLIILGEGEERAKLDALRPRLRIRDMHLPGHVANPYAYMARADVLVMSSRHEGFGNVLIEAMACGCPVVSTDCYGPREVLDNGRYGRLVPIGEHVQMAITIKEILRSPCGRFPKALLQSRAAEFGIERIANRYMDLLGVASIQSATAGPL